MGIFDFLVKKPMDNWSKIIKQELLFDLSAKSLNGITFGEEYKRLMTFGKPNNKDAYQEGKFVYLPLGLEVEIKKDKISQFGFILQDEFNEGFNYNKTQLILNDKKEELTVKTTLENMNSLFGAPYNFEETKEELITFYKINGLMLEMEFSKEKKLKRVNIYSEKKGHS